MNKTERRLLLAGARWGGTARRSSAAPAGLVRCSRATAAADRLYLGAQSEVIRAI